MKSFTRIIALLLVPCLLADPSLASAFSRPNAPIGRTPVTAAPYQTEAIVALLAASTWAGAHYAPAFTNTLHQLKVSLAALSTQIPSLVDLAHPHHLSYIPLALALAGAAFLMVHTSDSQDPFEPKQDPPMFHPEGLRDLTPIEAAIEHIQYLQLHGQYQAAYQLAEMLLRDLEGLAKHYDFVSKKWAAYYPAAKGVPTLKTYLTLHDPIKTLTADLKARKAHAGTGTFKDRLRSTLTTTVINYSDADITVTLSGDTGSVDSSGKGLSVGLPGTPTTAKLMGSLRRLFALRKLYLKHNWSLRIENERPRLGNTLLTGKELFEVVVEKQTPHDNSRFITLEEIKKSLGGNAVHPGYVVEAMMKKMYEGRVIRDIRLEELISFWDTLEIAIPSEMGGASRQVVKLPVNLYFSGGPLAMRFVPETENSPVITIEVLTETEMARRLEDEIRQRNNRIDELGYERSDIFKRLEIPGLVFQFFTTLRELREFPPRKPFWGIYVKHPLGHMSRKMPDNHASNSKLMKRLIEELRSFDPRTEFRVFPRQNKNFSFMAIIHAELDHYQINYEEALQDDTDTSWNPPPAAILMGTSGAFWFNHPYWAALMLTLSFLSWYRSIYPRQAKQFLTAA